MPVALVTGGSRRVGAEITRHLHETHDVIVQTRCRNAYTVAFVASLNTQRANSARWIAADLDSADEIAALAAGVGPRLDALIINASRFEQCDDTFDAAWVGQLDRHMHTNVAMPIVLVNHLRQALIAARGEGGQPSVVWILDTHRNGLFPNHSAYALSRAAGTAAVNTLAHALAPDTRVVGLAPGTVLTSERSEKAISETIERKQILGSAGGTPADVAQAVRFVVDTPFVNATIISVDGGRSSWPSSRD